jgi:hypothetical protein
VQTVTRLVAYGGVLLFVFGLAWTVGEATSPAAGQTVSGAYTATAPGGVPGSGAAGHDHGAGATSTRPDLGASSADSAGSAGGHGRPSGLAVSESGYTLVPDRREFPRGVPLEFAFRVTGSDAGAVTAFDVQHDRRLHLIVVGRDTTGFQHLHPELGSDGVWRTPLTLPSAGVWRVFADFVPTGGPALVLGTDLFVPGSFAPADLPAPTRTATVDGYEITLDGALVPGAASQLVAKVSRGGVPVTDLEPHLGAFGHLVALRADDLAYLHVHPDAAGTPTPTDRTGPQIAFTAEVPSSATYRLFLDFRHGGAVRTAEFTLTTADSPTAG